MAGYTRVGDVTRWVKLKPLACDTRWLWIALYTDSQRVIPGLWRGGIGSMQDLVGFDRQQTIRCLDQLLEHELVEYDAAYGVLRLTELPDAFEWPMNGSTLVAWWRRFLDVPACPVRDAHLRLIGWLIETGTRESALRAGKKNEISADLRATWAETFQQIPMPSKRRHGVKRLLDEDTSTAVQPSLFAAPTPTPTPTPIMEQSVAPGHGVDHPGERERVSVPDLVSGSSQLPESGEQAARQDFVVPEHTPPPGPPPTPTPTPDVIALADTEVYARRQLGDEIWDLLNAKRLLIACELGLPTPRHLHDQLPGRRALMERLRESGDHAREDASHVLALGEAEARANKTLQWFSGSMFEPKSWAYRLSSSLADVTPKQQSAFDVVDEVFAKRRRDETEMPRGDTS